MDDLLGDDNLLDDLLNMTPEVAGMVWEYRLHDPDPYFLSDILRECSKSGDSIPSDLLLDASKMVLQKRERKTRDRIKRKTTVKRCRAVWRLHYGGGLPIDAGLFERVGYTLGCSGSAVRDSWYGAPEIFRKPPPKDMSTPDRIKEKILTRYPVPKD